MITIVLYFGQKHWNYGRSLADIAEIPEFLKPFVNDYTMKCLYEVAFMDPEDVKLFRSDFRYVADYFVQMHRSKHYRPSPETIRHVDETLKMMHVLTGNHRFEEAANALRRSEERSVNMVDVFEEYIEQGVEKGRKEGQLLGEVNIYYNVLNYSPERIAEETHQPVAVISQVIQDLKQKK